MSPETFNLWDVAESMPCRHQQQFGSNVWTGIVGECLVGPQVSSHRLTGNHYRGFLSHDLPKLLEAVPLAAEHEYGTCMMMLCAVRYVLSNTYHDRWTGRGGPTAWPPRSPDLNPLGLYLWGHIKFLCMQLLLITKRHFTIAVWMPVKTIRNCPGITERMWWSMLRRVEACTGGHFEHLYVYSFRCNSHIKYFQAHGDTRTFFLVLVFGTRAQNLSTPFSYTL
jgi:hypothetical protein